MRKTNHPLNLTHRNALVDRLNISLAEMIDFYLNVKQAHWNVQGRSFFSLHELFDKLAESIEVHIDEIAERVMALGGMAQGTLATVAKSSKLAAYPQNITKADDHLKALIKVLAFCIKHIRDLIDFADKHQDHVSADMATRIASELEKYLWFLEAHLPK